MALAVMLSRFLPCLGQGTIEGNRERERFTPQAAVLASIGASRDCGPQLRQLFGRQEAQLNAIRRSFGRREPLVFEGSSCITVGHI